MRRRTPLEIMPAQPPVYRHRLGVTRQTTTKGMRGQKVVGEEEEEEDAREEE